MLLPLESARLDAVKDLLHLLSSRSSPLDVLPESISVFGCPTAHRSSRMVWMSSRNCSDAFEQLYELVESRIRLRRAAPPHRVMVAAHRQFGKTSTAA